MSLHCCVNEIVPLTLRLLLLELGLSTDLYETVRRFSPFLTDCGEYQTGQYVFYLYRKQNINDKIQYDIIVYIYDNKINKNIYSKNVSQIINICVLLRSLVTK